MSQDHSGAFLGGASLFAPASALPSGAELIILVAWVTRPYVGVPISR